MVTNVRVASISFNGCNSKGSPRNIVEKNLDKILKLLEKAVNDKPDIICLPECSPMLGMSIPDMIKVAEKIPGPIFNSISAFAKKHKVYIVCPMIESRETQIFNSAVLIDRYGEHVGSYYKIHPIIREIQSGITPGIEPKIYETDFGVLGLAICYDLNFQDVIDQNNKKIDIIFFPSMYPGGLQLKIWAFNYGSYITSANTEGQNSMIVDPLGNILVSSSMYNPIICTTLNFDYEVFHMDYNIEKLDLIKEKYGPMVEIDMSRQESVFILKSNMKDVTVEDLIQEFDLETRKEYFLRSNDIRYKALLLMDK
jgi:predicted amidohydrolase